METENIFHFSVRMEFCFIILLKGHSNLTKV
jgi:hypothetical protein